MMRAVVQDRYGSPDGLELRELDPPRIGDREVLVRVHAAGLHVGDTFFVRGSPFLVRLSTGLRRPRYGVPGMDLAGRVEAVGSAVTTLEVGDEVFGAGRGTCAELAVSPADEVVRMPAGLGFEAAAAVPTSALAALHGLRDAGRLRAGQRVLVIGASGGVGTFAVQIAKALGAEVTGVCSTGNVELVRSLGADRVIDRTREDFTTGGAVYDLILDNNEDRSLSEVRRALAPEGTLVLNSGTGASGIGLIVRLVRPIILSPFVGHELRRYLSQPNQADLLVLRGLIEDGRLRPVVSATFPLEETAEALRRIESRHARGKIVVTVLPPAGGADADPVGSSRTGSIAASGP